MATLVNMVAMILALGMTSSLFAQQANDQGIANKTYQKADSAESIQAMKRGDRYAVVASYCLGVRTRVLK